MPKEINISMLGALTVGKTSLLTAMYEKFDNTIGKVNLQLTPDLESSAKLSERLGELKSLLDDFESTAGRIQSTLDIRSFIFDLGQKGAKPSTRLKFYDFPGEYLEPKSSPKAKEELQKIMTQSDVVMIAIDAPALMEAQGKFHEKINKPQQITDLFKSVYQDIKSPKLVIFAPVKCEKYMQNTQDNSNLILKQIKEKYSKLLDLFASEALKPWITSVVTPVQTVGTVIFSRIEIIDQEPSFFFRKISHNAGYEPKYSEQPLLYLLRFILTVNIYYQTQSWFFISLIYDWLGWNKNLEQAVEEATKNCKRTGEFAVLQGEKWLEIEKMRKK